MRFNFRKKLKYMTSRKKILFFLPQLDPGGAERVTINIIRLLDKNLFDIHLATLNLNGHYLDFIPKEVELHELNVSKTLFSILRLRKVIENIQPDVLFSSLFRSHIACDMALIGMKNKPFTVFRSPNSPKLILKNRQMGPLYKYLLEHAYQRANILLAQTPEMKQEIAYYHNIAENKIIIFINPLDIEHIKSNLLNIKNPFDKNFINIIASGRLSYQKGFDILIKAFKPAVEINNKLHLHIIGEDDGEEKNLKSLVKKLSLEKNVHFLGFQSNPYKFYYFSDLYILSSRWEGLPNTVLENLYLNKPIIATKCIPFMANLISNGKNGLLVDVENIEQLTKAILNFKNIRPNRIKNEKQNEDINKLFLDFCTGTANCFRGKT